MHVHTTPKCKIATQSWLYRCYNSASFDSPALQYTCTIRGWSTNTTSSLLTNTLPQWRYTISAALLNKRTETYTLCTLGTRWWAREREMERRKKSILKQGNRILSGTPLQSASCDSGSFFRQIPVSHEAQLPSRCGQTEPSNNVSSDWVRGLEFFSHSSYRAFLSFGFFPLLFCRVDDCTKRRWGLHSVSRSYRGTRTPSVHIKSDHTR